MGSASNRIWLKKHKTCKKLYICPLRETKLSLMSASNPHLTVIHGFICSSESLTSSYTLIRHFKTSYIIQITVCQLPKHPWFFPPASSGKTEASPNQPGDLLPPECHWGKTPGGIWNRLFLIWRSRQRFLLGDEAPHPISDRENTHTHTQTVAETILSFWS